ncbi:hypothetical protein J1N35_045007, partial [Gossypium stocksii]
IRIRHIPRAQNMTADQMAKCVYDNSLSLKLFEVPPSSVNETLHLDNHFLNINI